MIIQCRKCETRFRFDDALIVGDGVWVRCSRCQHVFFQQRSAGEDFAGEPEIPTVRISDAKRNVDERFPETGERLQRTEKEPEAMSPTPIRPEKEPEADFDREPSIEELSADLGKETLEDLAVARETLASLAAADEKEGFELEEEELPAAETAGKGWGGAFLKWFALLVFVAVVAGALYLYLFPQIRNQVFTWAAPWLQGVPVLENLVPPQMKSSGTVAAPVRIKDVRQRSVTNLLAGNLGVIEGVAVNQAPYVLGRIRVRLVITDAYDVVLGEKIVYCGNLLTDAELGALADAEIQRELSIQQGSDVPNERIAPNGEIPFMIVFNQEQTGAIKTTVIPAGADRLP